MIFHHSILLFLITPDKTWSWEIIAFLSRKENISSLFCGPESISFLALQLIAFPHCCQYPPPWQGYGKCYISKLLQRGRGWDWWLLPTVWKSKRIFYVKCRFHFVRFLSVLQVLSGSIFSISLSSCTPIFLYEAATFKQSPFSDPKKQLNKKEKKGFYFC